MAATIKVNGVSLPSPTKYDWGYMDVDKSGRTASADLVRDRVATKRKIELEWHLITAEETSMILKAVKPKFIEVEFHDAELNKMVTGTFYAGDRRGAYVVFKNGIPTNKGVAFNLTER